MLADTLSSLNNNVTIAIASVTAAAVILAATTVLVTKQKRAPPGPKGWPLLGDLLAFARHSANKTANEYFFSIAQQYGPISSFTVLGRTVVLVSDKTLVHHMATDMPEVSKIKLFQTAADSMFHLALGTMPDSPSQKLRRKLLSPAFSPSNLRMIGNTVSKITSAWCTHFIGEAIVRGGSITLDIYKEISAITLDVLGQVAFYFDFKAVQKLHDGSDNKDQNIFNEMLLIIQERIELPEAFWHLVGLNNESKRVKTVSSHINSIVRTIIAEREAADIAGNSTEHSKGTAMLDQMLKLDEHGNRIFTDEEVINEVAGFYFAGQETAANTLTFAVLELCKHPRMAKRIASEVVEVKKQIGDDINSDNIHLLKYLDAFVKETQRLHTIVFGLLRESNSPIDIDGYHISAGTQMILCIEAIHHDPELWPNPDTFDPDRFLGGQEIAPNSFVPFGDGPRICLGMKMALLEIKLVLVHLVTRFDFELVPGQNLQPVYTLTIGLKNGLNVKLTPK